LKKWWIGIEILQNSFTKLIINYIISIKVKYKHMNYSYAIKLDVVDKGANKEEKREDKK